MPKNKIRLQKFLADAGVASRRKSEELILQGAVRVNNRPAKIGDSVDPEKDTVTVRGKRVFRAKNLYYILLNKPRGYVTTTDDDLGRKCVNELVNIKERIYPVGRLDRVSEGALILTNDGAFANALMHPSHHVPKTYRVTVKPDITASQVKQLSEGVELDGRMTAPADVHVIDRADDRAVIEIVLYEGRNRQIRRMCELLGLQVSRLKRTAIGPVSLGSLPVGRYRDLTEKEISALMSAADARKE